MIELRRKLMKLITNIVGYSVISGTTAGIGAVMLCAGIIDLSFGLIVFGFILLGFCVFSAIRGDMHIRILRKEIKILTETPLETIERVKNEKEKDVF